jgi:glycosyltransferase involved in cell wall biosynthesis
LENEDVISVINWFLECRSGEATYPGNQAVFSSPDKMAKPKILLVSHTVPENKMGGALILFRHFVLKNDFEIGVVTNNPAGVPGVFHRHLPEPRLLGRLKKTRLNLWAEDYTHLVHSRIFDGRLYEAALEFKPDIIFNVAETYFSFHAQKLAKKLNIPFVAYFMDWATFATRSHGWAKPHMDRMFRQLYREADLAFCISEGMKKELGPHPNSHVLYPSGADIHLAEPPAQPANRKFTFCFAGNLYQWYGRMVQDLIREAEGDETTGLKIFGTNHQWTKEFVDDQTSKGVFHGFRPFEQLVPEFQNADAFLLVMGFGADEALIERTSFKTKLLDYILFEKPILVWGPEYSTAVEIAKKFGCAYCVTDPSPKAALAGMKELAANRTLRDRLVKNATAMRETELNHNIVHSILITEVGKLIKKLIEYEEAK